MKEDWTVLFSLFPISAPIICRSADVNKVARAQGANVTEAPPIGIGEDAITSSAEEEADRALQTVRKKLDVQLSVEYAVNKLIQDATSPVCESESSRSQALLLCFFYPPRTR
jgi:hypothetical protein